MRPHVKGVLQGTTLVSCIQFGDAAVPLSCICSDKKGNRQSVRSSETQWNDTKQPLHMKVASGAENKRTFRPAAFTSSGFPDNTRSNCVLAPSLSPDRARSLPYSKSTREVYS